MSVVPGPAGRLGGDVLQLRPAPRRALTETNQRFARLLLELMQRDGVGSTIVGRACGKDPSSVNAWLSGKCLPMDITVGEDLAAFFHHAGLISALVADKSRRCASCRRQFQQHLKRGKYCSKRCMVRDKSRRHRATVAARELTIITHERDRLRDAVEANCFSCEPDRICRDRSCPIQVAGVSPYPLISIQRRQA